MDGGQTIPGVEDGVVAGGKAKSRGHPIDDGADFGCDRAAHCPHAQRPERVIQIVALPAPPRLIIAAAIAEAMVAVLLATWTLSLWMAP